MLVDALSDQQRRFCEEYLIDLKPKAAAIRAGYSEHSASSIAYELLQRPQVEEYITYLKAEHATQYKVTKDYVLAKIIETVERCAQDVQPVLDRKGKQVEVVTKEGEFAKAYTFDSRGVLKGAELLGRHLAMFTDVTDNRMTFTQMGNVLIGDPNAPVDQQKALTFDVGSDPNQVKTS